MAKSPITGAGPIATALPQATPHEGSATLMTSTATSPNERTEPSGWNESMMRQSIDSTILA
jgi:hypothetical protein